MLKYCAEKLSSYRREAMPNIENEEKLCNPVRSLIFFRETRRKLKL